MVIVIDALNECDEQGMVEFIETVTKACMRRIRPFPIRILMTSRFEKHLRGIFGSSAAPSIIYPLDSQILMPEMTSIASFFPGSL